MNRHYPSCIEMEPTQIEDQRECRKHPRKLSHLTGVRLRLKGNQERIPIVVENLSMTGVRIRLQQGCELERGELLVEFTLDDGFNTLLCLKGEVRWALSGSAGIKFTCPACLIHILTNYMYA